MGRKGISVEHVAAAYQSLLLQRRKPGPQNIRLELGRGSYSTITKLLRELQVSMRMTTAQQGAAAVEERKVQVRPMSEGRAKHD